MPLRKPIKVVPHKGGSLARVVGPLSNGVPTPPPAIETGETLFQFSSTREAIKMKADRRRLIDKENNALMAEWRKKGVSDLTPEERKKCYRLVLNPDVDIESEEWEDCEERIEAVGYSAEKGNGTFDVIQKVACRFADIVYILSESKSAALDLVAWEEIDSVTPLHTVKTYGSTETYFGVNAFFPDIGESCTSDQTLTQAAKTDALEGGPAENIGGSVAVLVWDATPVNRNTVNTSPEFKDRPGGELVIFESSRRFIDDHGVKVSSICCGAAGGIATGSNVALLEVSDNVQYDLSEIDELAESLDLPLVVCMSFGLTFGPGLSQVEFAEAEALFTSLNATVEAIMERHPQVTFVAAAGNESINSCQATAPLSWEDCANCVSWPQTTFPGKDNPIILVGGSNVPPVNPITRLYSGYSNFGPCVDVFSNGGPYCAWDNTARTYKAVVGTSFSAPQYVGLTALVYSKNPTMTHDQVLAVMQGSRPNNVTNVSANTTSRFQILPSSARTGGGDVVTNADWGDILEFDPQDTDDGAGFPWWTIGLGIGIAVILVIVIVVTYTTNKHKRGRGVKPRARPTRSYRA